MQFVCVFKWVVVRSPYFPTVMSIKKKKRLYRERACLTCSLICYGQIEMSLRGIDTDLEGQYTF